MIDTVSYSPKIELFARQKFPGWDCFGNEVDSDIILDIENNIFKRNKILGELENERN